MVLHEGVLDRFLRYVQIDTQSDPLSNSFPSSSNQKNLANLLASELKAMGLLDAEVDEFGYVYATLPSNTAKQVPVICFCSHMDTAPDCSGNLVKPIVHHQYSGEDIVLPDDESQIISVHQYPYLKKHIGKTIITASGQTLLGADDKAGIAEIMSFVAFLIQHPTIKHGEVKILFTPDEEIGMGTAKLDLKRLSAAYAYTLDGGELATLEDETFSADGVTISIQGVIAHPGYAKGKMVNALKIAAAIITALPKESLCPEHTEGREGFIHLLRVEGLAESAKLDFLIRDFITENLAKHEATLQSIAESVLKHYPRAGMSFEVKEQYRNMKEVLAKHPHVLEYAEEAYRNCGLIPVKEPIRGGTDGSRMSFMGLPCPNLFTGMQAIHSKHEWIGLSDMEKSVDMLVELVQVWERNAIA